MKRPSCESGSGSGRSYRQRAVYGEVIAALGVPVFRPLVVPARTSEGSADAGAPLYLNLLGAFRLQIADRPVVLPTHARRILAYLSVCIPGETTCSRATIGDRLWPEADVNRARASLRTALWRIGRADRRLVLADEDVLRLGGALRVDLYATLGQAARLARRDVPLRADDCAITPLSMDLLPGWDEDWLLLERERVRQLQLHALDALSHRLRTAGRYSEAVDSALAAIALEPLRESAHAALVAAHLAEGNVAAAHRQLDGYARLLWTELHLRPSPLITALFDREMRNPRGVADRRVPDPGPASFGPFTANPSGTDGSPGGPRHATD